MLSAQVAELDAMLPMSGEGPDVGHSAQVSLCKYPVKDTAGSVTFEPSFLKSWHLLGRQSLAALRQAEYRTLAQATLVLSPGAGLGSFRLGQPLPEVLALVRSAQHRALFSRCVEIKYEQDPGVQQGDLALCFPEHGTHLLFDGTQQRLRLIEVYDTTRLQVRFGGHVFGGAAHTPTFGRVCEAFGPTYPGEASGGQYPLQYPGVLFLFPITAASGPSPAHLQQQQPRHPQGLLGGASAALPVPLSTPAARIVVHHGAAPSLAAARAAPPPPLAPGSTYWERVEAVPCQGLLLGSSGQLLRFGDAPQDVVSELGPPSSTHMKPARASAAGRGASTAAAAPDYYYCYASRGFDVLFSGSTHQLKKLVLHANQPGHPDFGLYSRCNFRVHPAGSWSLSGGSSSSGDGGGGGSGGGTPREEAQDSPLAAYTSAGSDGGASMRTAASEASLAATEAAAVAAQHGAAHARMDAGSGSSGSSPRAAQQPQQQAGKEQPASGLTAAYQRLSLNDGVVVAADGDATNSSSRSGIRPLQAAADAHTHASAAAVVAGGAELDGAVADAGDGDGGGADGTASAGAAGMGRPPRPPTSLPIPAPPPAATTSKGGGAAGSKKKKKKDKQRAAAAARLLAATGGGGGDESANDATDTDASFADSAPSSLASSPGMTSFLSNIAATGGGVGLCAGGPRKGPAGAPAGGGAAAAAGVSGYTSDSSTADFFAGKERRLENGSAFDGWSEADDLALLVGEETTAGTAAAAAAAVTTASGLIAGGLQQQQAGEGTERQRRPLRVSTAVQTAAGADEAGDATLSPAPLGIGATSADVATSADPDSPESYILADSPQLFDESTAADEYESVPRQRSSGTQTQPHLLAGLPALRGGGGGGSGAAQRRHRAAASAAPSVGVCSSLVDLQAVFGAGAKPALHTRLGGRHPFGPTHLFAYRGAVFEVLHNGSIATVTLFEA